MNEIPYCANMVRWETTVNTFKWDIHFWMKSSHVTITSEVVCRSKFSLLGCKPQKFSLVVRVLLLSASSWPNKCVVLQFFLIQIHLFSVQWEADEAHTIIFIVHHLTLTSTSPTPKFSAKLSIDREKLLVVKEISRSMYEYKIIIIQAHYIIHWVLFSSSFSSLNSLLDLIHSLMTRCFVCVLFVELFSRAFYSAVVSANDS